MARAPAAATGTTAVFGSHVLTLKGGAQAVLSDHWVLVEGDRIAAVTPHFGTRAKPGPPSRAEPFASPTGSARHVTAGHPMDRIIYLDGAFVPAADARVSVMDRGFLFADGIYEVSAVLDGRLVDNDAHLARLDRSLEAIGIANPHTAAEWARLQAELVRRNGLAEGVVYIQVTRGAAERDFAYAPDLVPTVVMFTQAKAIVDAPVQGRGARVVTRPDLRWARRDIKSVGLLAQVMAKREAAAAGASEAFMVEDGFITEGGSSTVFIVTSEGAVVTRPLSNTVLPGITRLAVMRLTAEAGLTLQERAIGLEEAYGAEEVFFTSASNFVVPVVSIDGRSIGGGRPGPRTKRLQTLYIDLARAEARSSASSFKR